MAEYERGEESKSMFTKMSEEMDQLRPAAGFNLVGRDDFEDFGEQLYFIAHYATIEEAREARDRRLQEDPNEDLIIYNTRGLSVE